jgi:hypothetical protein
MCVGDHLNSVMCALRTCTAVNARHLRTLPSACPLITPPNPDARTRTSCRDPRLGLKLGPRRMRRWSCRSGITFEGWPFSNPNPALWAMASGDDGDCAGALAILGNSQMRTCDVFLTPSGLFSASFRTFVQICFQSPLLYCIVTACFNGDNRGTKNRDLRAPGHSRKVQLRARQLFWSRFGLDGACILLPVNP